MEPLLHECFADTGYGMGVFRSPLPVGNTVQIGWLLNYPTGIGRESMERELMRHFKFQIAIALDTIWPVNPGSEGKKWKPGAKTGSDDQAWHVYVESRYVKMVEEELSNWLRTSTRKGDMPFGARTRFVSDWKHIKSRRCTIASNSTAVSKATTSFIGTHNTFSVITRTLQGPFPMPGMLDKAPIPSLNNKAITLLRFLYSLQCIPTPPVSHHLAATTDASSSSNDEVSQVSTSDSGETEDMADSVNEESNHAPKQNSASFNNPTKMNPASSNKAPKTTLSPNKATKNNSSQKTMASPNNAPKRTSPSPKNSASSKTKPTVPILANWQPLPRAQPGSNLSFCRRSMRKGLRLRRLESSKRILTTPIRPHSSQ